MEAATAAVVQSPIGLFTHSKSAGRSMFLAANSSELLRFPTAYPSSVKHNSSISFGKPMHKRGISFGSKRYTGVRASSSSSSDSCGSLAPIAPLRLESPTGQFLSQILLSHPHLVPAAVEQQLEQLQTEFDSEKHNEEPPVSGIELALYRRIAEVKAIERKKALEEILYALVVQKFMDADISLIPSVAPSESNQIDTQPSLDKKLEKLHSPEAYKMIQNHLSLILGNHVTDSNTVAQISKLKVGQVYAASVMYGYFIKRVDQRFQLEKTMKILPIVGDRDFHNGNDIESSRLRSYVMSFDGETLQRYATIRSKEAVNIIEKHTEALFGRPEIVETSQGSVEISFGGLRRLVLEAVTFGSFLWDVESFVDSSELFHKRGKLRNEV